MNPAHSRGFRVWFLLLPLSYGLFAHAQNLPAPGIPFNAEPQGSGFFASVPESVPGSLGRVQLPNPATSSAKAEPAPAVELAEPERVDLDMTALQTGDVLGERVEDQVWTIQAPAGRKLLQVPLVVQPGAQTVELRSSTVKLQGGRFLCWRLDNEIAPEPQTPSAQTGDPASGSGGASGGGTNVRPGIVLLDLPPEAPAAPTATPAANLSDAPPRLSRSVVLEPKGEVRWGLEVGLPNGTVKEIDQLYTLRIKGDLLRRKMPQPVKAETPPANETAQARNERIRRVQQERDRYQRDYAAYTELAKQVYNAPTKFTGPRPARFWAVFELTPNVRELTLEGPAPLPWKISLAQLEAIRALRSPVTVSDGNLPREILAHFTEVARLVEQNPHPLSLRAAAQVLANTRLLTLSQPNDAVHALAQAILKGNDPQARAILVRDLAGLAQPSPVSLDLLRQAAANPDPATQMLALRGLIKSIQQLPSAPAPGSVPGTNAPPAVDPVLARNLELTVSTTNRVLADPKAPAPDLVLKEVLEGLRGQGGGNSATTTSPIQVALANGINFALEDAARRDQAIVAVIAAAPEHALAAAWLDGRLLGTKDGQLTRRTLELLAQAKLAFVSAASAGTAAPAGGRSGPAVGSETIVKGRAIIDKAGNPQAELLAPVPLTQAQHALFKHLLAGDDEVRRLAFTALAAFELPAQEPMVADPKQAQQSVYGALRDAALAKSPVPTMLVDFLLRQPNAQAAQTLLVRLAGDSDPAFAVLVVEAFFGNVQRPLEQILQTLEAGEKARFVQRVYEAKKSKATRMTGLLRDKTGNNIATLTQWFARELMAGRLAEAAQWLTYYGGEFAALNQVHAADKELAQAAAAALVLHAGGDQSLADKLLKDLETLTTPEQMQAAWGKFRQTIWLGRAKAAAGTYRLVLKVYPAGVSLDAPPPPSTPEVPGASNAPGVYLPGMTPPTPTPGIPGAAPAEIKPDIDENLGVFTLEADDKSVRLANQPFGIALADNQFALRIDKPAQLKNVNNAKLAGLPVDRLTTALDLLWKPDGSWQGRTVLLDGRTLELTLQPAPAKP